MLRTIRLNGELGKRFGRVHRFAVQTPQEALRALGANFPALIPFLAESHERGVVYRCTVDRDVVGEDALSAPFSKSFSVTPLISGAGDVGKALLGVALIAAMAIPGFGPLGTATLGSMLGTAGTFITGIGASLLLSGVAGMLAPTPQLSANERSENPYFDGPVQTISQGDCVPFGYGEMIIGSKPISAGITVEDNFTNSPWLGGYPGDNGLL